MYEGAQTEETPAWDPNGITSSPQWSEAPAQPFDYSQVPPLPSIEIFSQTPQGEKVQSVGKPLEELKPETNEKNEDQEVLPPLGILDRGLTSLGLGPGGVYSEQWEPRLAEFIDEKKNLSHDSMIDLYHGLNGGLDKALAVLESPDEGVKQISGPCLAVYPVGQFWKPGDAGLKYSIPRGMIEFPGESKPDAKFRIDKGGVVTMVGGLESLPLSKYNGEVIRTERKRDIIGERVIDGYIEEEVIGEEVVPLTPEEEEAQKKITKRMSDLAEIRTLTDSIKAVAEGSAS